MKQLRRGSENALPLRVSHATTEKSVAMPPLKAYLAATASKMALLVTYIEGRRICEFQVAAENRELLC